jgi:hypothetical protein
MSIFAATTLALPACDATAIQLPGLPAEAAGGLKPPSDLTTPSASLSHFELLALGLDQAGAPLRMLAADGARRDPVSIFSPPIPTADGPRGAFSGRFWLWALGVTVVEVLIGLCVKLVLG